MQSTTQTRPGWRQDSSQSAFNAPPETPLPLDSLLEMATLSILSQSPASQAPMAILQPQTNLHYASHSQEPAMLHVQWTKGSTSQACSFVMQYAQTSTSHEPPTLWTLSIMAVHPVLSLSSASTVPKGTKQTQTNPCFVASWLASTAQTVQHTCNVLASGISSLSMGNCNHTAREHWNPHKLPCFPHVCIPVDTTCWYRPTADVTYSSTCLALHLLTRQQKNTHMPICPAMAFQAKHAHLQHMLMRSGDVESNPGPPTFADILRDTNGTLLGLTRLTRIYLSPARPRRAPCTHQGHGGEMGLNQKHVQQ